MTRVGPVQSAVAPEESGRAGTFFWQLILIAVVLVGVGLRLRQYLFNRALWLDEASLANNIVDRGVLQLLTERLAANQSAPPGFLLFTRGAVEAFGPHEWVLRLFPLIGGILSLVLALVLAQRELKSAAAKIVFVGLLALSPLLIYYASELKQYSTDVFFTLCILAAFSYRSSKQGTMLLSVTGFVVLLFSLSAFFVAAAAGLFILYEGTQSSRWRQTIVVGCAWSAGAALHGLYHLRAGVSRRYMKDWWGERDGFAPLAIDTFKEITWYPQALADLLHQAFVATHQVGPGFSRLQWSDPLPWFLGFLFVFSAIAAVRSRKAIFIVALGAILLTVAASAFRAYPFSSRLLIFLTPAGLLIIAAGIDAIDRKFGAVAAWSLSFLLLVVPGSQATRIALEPVALSDMRGAMEMTRGRLEEGDAVIGGRLNRSLVQFYRRDTIPENVPVFSIALKRDAELITDIVRKHGFRRVWFVAAHRIADAEQVIEETERAAPIVFRWSARGARLALFDFSELATGTDRQKPPAGGPGEKEPVEDEASAEPAEPPATR